MSRARLALGRAGERRAARYLRRRGLRILKRNWRGPGGELDLVALDGEQVVVVEVRTSGAPRPFAGGPEQTVGPEKLRRLRRLTSLYLLTLPRPPAGGVRIDVVAVVRRSSWRWELRWFPNVG